MESWLHPSPAPRGTSSSCFTAAAGAAGGDVDLDEVVEPRPCPPERRGRVGSCATAIPMPADLARRPRLAAGEGSRGADAGARRGGHRPAPSSAVRPRSSQRASTWRSASAGTARCCARSTWSPADDGAGPRRQRRPARLPHRGGARRDSRTPSSASSTGDYGIEERMTLGGRRPSRAPITRRVRARALNEAVLEKTQTGHTVRMLVTHRRRAVHHVRGRRAHRGHAHRLDRVRLSARGPDRVAAHRALLLTPVSPHMLFDRSLVLDPASRIRLEVVGDRPGDAVGRRAQPGRARPRATSSTAPRPPIAARLVTSARRNFHRILKAKFGLSDR